MSQSGINVLAQAISNAWNLTATELNTLLPYAGTSQFNSHEELRKLYFIHAILNELFVIKKRDEVQWLRDESLVLGGVSPLNFMLLNGRDGIERVYRMTRDMANW